MNSPVTMFHRLDVLAETLTWLRSHRYEIVELDASTWVSEAGMLGDMARRLDFPDYFGHNADALDDCLGDVASGEYGWDVSATGLVVLLRRFDAYVRTNHRSAQKLLDILSRNARKGLLIGNRLLCVVQTDDPQSSFEPVGAMSVDWNDAERLDSSRGV